MTINRSRAAISASSSCWRSSVRGSRSPTCGSSSIRSSPSRGALRGNTPSSSPSRQTTRCGTERIGTSVQIVRCPVRKFARVGRPRRRSASSDAELGQRQLHVVAGRLGDDVVEQPLQLGALPGVGRHGRRERVGARGEHVRPTRPTGCGRRSASSDDLEPVDQLGEPSGEVDRAALDVVEREHLGEQPLLVLGHRHAEQQPVEPGAPGARVQRLELERGAVLGVQAPADRRSPAPTPPAGRGRRRRARSGGGPARGRRGRAPARR